MEKNIKGFYRGLLAVLLIALYPILVGAGPAKPTKPVHPKLSEQEKYIDCAECHTDATPKVQKDWFTSLHGLAMVKCYQCHGTFETFRVTPTRQDCAACHAGMIKKCPQDKACWQCHIPHTFKTKK